MSKRTWTYVVFIDLRKAFDSVDRKRLVDILKESGVNGDLVRALANFLTGTAIRYKDEHRVDTNVGVPQGAVTSPTLFNIYINDLVCTLHAATRRTLAFADDICFVAQGRAELERALDLVQAWTQRSGIKLNTAKSGILVIRADRRTRMQVSESYTGIPVLASYKYLGVEVSDCADIAPLKQSLTRKQALLKRQLGLQWAGRMDTAMRYLAWQSLLKSKVLYGTFVMAHHEPRLK